MEGEFNFRHLFLNIRKQPRPPAAKDGLGNPDDDLALAQGVVFEKHAAQFSVAIGLAFRKSREVSK